jgi:protein FrlC
MVKEVDSKNFGTLLDSGHVNVTGESLTDYVFQLADKLKHLHLDDNDGHSDDHLVPGMGNMNFVPLFAALKKIGYQGAVSIEAGISFSTDPDSAAQEGISFLNQHL